MEATIWGFFEPISHKSPDYGVLPRGEANITTPRPWNWGAHSYSGAGDR